MNSISANLAFLSFHDPQLDRLETLAERYFQDDPNTCLMKLRQFGEVLAQLTAAHAGMFTATDERQADLLRRLRTDDILPHAVAAVFHQLRVIGNKALLSKVQIPLPTLDEQCRIVAHLDALQANVDAMNAARNTAAELDALLPSLLDRGFKGELCIS